MPEPKPKGGSFLTRKVAGQPTWVWAGVILAAFLLYRRFSSGASNTPSTSSPTTTGPSDLGSAGGYPSTSGTGTAGPGLVDTSALDALTSAIQGQSQQLSDLAASGFGGGSPYDQGTAGVYDIGSDTVLYPGDSLPGANQPGPMPWQTGPYAYNPVQIPHASNPHVAVPTHPATAAVAQAAQHVGTAARGAGHAGATAGAMTVHRVAAALPHELSRPVLAHHARY